ncbi:S8 family serine peptidase [Lysobacter sp. CA199]|uniref:S8 family serine peptidase n=1 Tax=Lysobacter sp. CA199 TaxID=3455608 RepID=UPI003F8D4169
MSTGSTSFNVLSVATALAIACVSGSAFAADRVDVASLSADGSQAFGRFLVTYKSGSAPRSDVASFNRSTTAAATAVSSRFGGGKRAVQLKRLRRTATGTDVVVSSRALNRDEAAALMKQLAADPNVESVSNDIMMVPYFTPNDTNFSQQFGFGSGNGGIRATSAWDVTKGEGTVVAVIDTGIVSHSDLNANVIAGYDMISGDSVTSGFKEGGFIVANDGDGRDANPADPGDWFTVGQCPNAPTRSSASSWHGSHVAGTVAAVTNNGKGVAGTAHAAKVLPVRVLGPCGGFGSDISDAIIWASGGSVPGVPANPNPADVINLSLGGNAPDACPPSYKSAVASAAARGSIVVVAAGNSDADVTTSKDKDGNVVGYTMTNCGTVISVGAVTSSGARSSFSSFGTAVDIAGPGSAILSTVNNGTQGPTTEAYKSYSGTSMAAPHVAGVAALVQSIAPTPLTQEQMRTLLKNTARAFPVSPGAKPIGVGIVDAAAAVAAAGGAPPTGSTQTYSNATAANIPDNNATGATSTITVSGRTGNAPSSAEVAVNIVHTYQGDLIVDLIAPDGTVYNLHNRTGSSADNIVKTYTVNLSSEALNGAWKLRAADRAGGDTGRIANWSVKF